MAREHGSIVDVCNTFGYHGRPYVDGGGNRKPLGLIVDFVGVLRELKKALQFDSADLAGVIESLDELMAEFLVKIEEARSLYLDAGTGGGDERLERIAYVRFGDPQEREGFFDAYEHLENLWEILSPDPQLRDHIKTFELLAGLYTAVRIAYADKWTLRPTWLVKHARSSITAHSTTG